MPTPRLVRLAVRAVPRPWRETVQQDLTDEAGESPLAALWSAVAAIGIGLALHGTFTRAAVMTELRYTLKSMFRAPAFALGAILTFALGIGVNVAVFAAVDRMLFRPLPYSTPDRLFIMGQYAVGSTMPYGTVPAMYVVAALHTPAVESLTTSDWNADTYRLTEEADRATYFGFVPMAYTALGALGVHPILGHDFTIDDVRAKRSLVLITQQLWQREFGGRPDVVGRRIWGEAPGTSAQIAGVLPDDFITPQMTFPKSWSGISLAEETFESATPRDRSTPPFVRLKPGVTLAEAQGQVDGLVASLRSQFPPLPPGVPASQVRLMPLREALFGRYATYVALVFAAATLVLLVGCANLASLLLVRARSRERRAAMQLALGASPGRLVQSAVIEAVLLAVIGTTLALAVLRLADQAIASWLPATFSRYAAPVFASRVLIFSVLLATGSALIAGILPGWRSARVDVLAVLQRGTGRAGSGRLRGSGALLAVEIAVSTLLVACAVLTGRTLVSLVNTSVGFNPNQLLSVSASLAPGKDPVQLLRQYRDMLEVIDHMPGVEAAAGADILPVIGAVNMPMFKGDKARGQRWAITERFVETMGMPIVAGRTLTAAEVEANAPVGLLSESGVRLRWPGVAPSAAVGRLLDFPGEASRQIVGVVSDVRYPYTADPFPSLYVPLGADGFRRMMFAVRLAPGRTLTTGDVVHTLREHGYVPTFARVDRVADNFAMSVVDQRFRAQLFLGFGVVAVVLAVIGVYAVQSFIVMLRLSEFGIRVSLGASPRDLWRMLILETMRPTVVGVVLGLIATVWAGQFLQAFLVGIQARDPWTFASVAVLLFFASALAAWVPARRASRTDPAIVLRAQ